MNITMAADDNYAEIMITSIHSICKNNAKSSIVFYVIDSGISKKNRTILDTVIKKYPNKSIHLIHFEDYAGKIEAIVKKTDPPLPLITFARLFLADVIDAQKTIYVDCDTICNGSLEELWNMDLGDKTLAGVEDTVSEEIKTKIGLKPNDRYINAGILVIRLDKWREKKFTQRAVKYIEHSNGMVMHNDQGVINGLFHNEIKIVSLRYNAMTPLFMISRDKICKYFHMSHYYDKEEIREARKNPCFIHFVRFTTSRPWEKGCTHPYASRYQENYFECFGTYPVLLEYSVNKMDQILFWQLNKLPFFFYFLTKTLIQGGVRMKLLLKGKGNGKAKGN